MFRYFKLSIEQLFCLTTIASSLLFLATHDREEPLWRESVFPYDQPDVPRSFRQITDQPIVVVWPMAESRIIYDDIEHLYLKNHYHGWQSTRALFHQGYEWLVDYDAYDFYLEYDYSKLSFRDPMELSLLAQWEGRKQCREQLSERLKRADASALRRQMAYSHFWVAFPPLLILVAAVLYLAIRCPLDWRQNALQRSEPSLPIGS